MTSLLWVRAARKWRGDEGLTLIELFVAMFVLSVAVLGLAGVATASLTQLRASRDRDLATNVASSTIEQLRGVDFDRVAIFDAADAEPGCFADERVIEVDSADDGIGFTRTEGPNGRFTVTTYVTWLNEAEYDEGEGEEVDPASCAAPTDEAAKRVTVVASWSSPRGADREVRESTIVAEAGRGLPVPDFRLLPEDQPVTFTPSEVAAGAEKCVSHLLTNTGAEDSYEWRPLRSKDIGAGESEMKGPEREGPYSVVLDGVPATVTYEGVFFIKGSDALTAKVKVRALFEYDLNHDPDDEDSTSVSDASADDVAHNVEDPDGPPQAPYLDPEVFESMEDGIAESGASPTDGRPETSRRVPNRQNARLWFCYRLDVATQTGTTYEFDIQVNSQFDEDRIETVSHSVAIGADPVTLHLFDPDDTQDHKRNLNQVYTMGSLNPPNDVLGTGGPFDWDTDQDPFGNPFVWLGSAEGSSVALNWDHQFATATTISQDVQLRLYSAPSGAFTLTPPADPTPTAMTYTVVFERLKSNEKPYNPRQIIHTATLTYGHTTADWAQIDATLDLTADTSQVSFAAEEYLRLTVYCSGATTFGGTTNDDDCNVAYDHESYPSALRIDRLSS
ncbi:MAG TPA: hypothetical protein VGA36_09540 [Nitriliruptorales bacterium]